MVEVSVHQQDGGPRGHPDHHFVQVTVDCQAKTVRKGKHVVSEFKELVGVDASYELDEVVAGEFVPLADDAALHIKGGEVFVSHVRRGGSS